MTERILMMLLLVVFTLGILFTTPLGFEIRHQFFELLPTVLWSAKVLFCALVLSYFTAKLILFILEVKEAFDDLVIRFNELERTFSNHMDDFAKQESFIQSMSLKLDSYEEKVKSLEMKLENAMKSAKDVVNSASQDLMKGY